MPRFVLACFVSLICISIEGVGDDAAEVGEPDGFRRLAVTVRDPEGEPVPEVRVIPWALGSEEGHGIWREDLFGAPQEAMTNARGEAVIRYPEFHFEQAKTNIVSVNLVHPEYCLESLHLRTPSAPQELGGLADPSSITLRRGTQLRVAVVEGDGSNLVPGAHLLIGGHTFAAIPLFTRRDDNWHVSRPLPAESKWVRAVRLREEGPPLFSSLFRWDRDDIETHEIVLSLEPGVRVEGRVDDSVPRPVRNGRVVACATDAVTSPTVMCWRDVAEILEDGSFVFESLPKESDIQLVALCDGFVSQSPTQENLSLIGARYGREIAEVPFRYPQVFEAETSVIRPVMRMARTGTCRIQVVAPDGSPVSGVMVSFWPNQSIIGWGSNVLGTGHRSADTLRTGRHEIIGDKDFQRLTDGEGYALVTNLPVGERWFAVSTPDFRRTYRLQGGDTEHTVVISADEPANARVVLEQKPD